MTSKEECVTQSLGDRMKGYEMVSRTFISNELPAIIRIDGHKFSKFTKGLKKPYDKWLHDLMVVTASHLMREYNAVTAYTQSDEITLILAPKKGEDGKYLEYQFAGQIQKYVSLVAGRTTNIFMNELRKMINSGKIQLNEYKEHIQEKLKNPPCYFDARISNVPNLIEAFNNIYWRSTYDCIRNSISLTGHTYCGHKSIEGLNCDEIKEKLIKEKNIDWESLDPHFKYGTFIKNLEVIKPIDEKYTKYTENKTTNRHQLWAICVKISTFDDTYLDFLFGKYLKPTDYPNIKLIDSYAI